MSLGRWNRSRAAVVVALSLASACSSVRTDVLQLGAPQPPRTGPEDIVVYQVGDPQAPTVPPHLKVGEITANDSKKPLADIVAKMKEDAAELGADVLVVQSEQRQSGSYHVSTAFGTSRPRMTNFVKASAIRLQR